ncbi:hypothetical protein ACKWRH_31010 [Bradyrhizobium sp. Pa8]|uniref:hypothetical protein n=1 Tax=Bradyrhizobium sp. Pa8 TaxID=3386552 RepID=UPI00403F36AE
MKFCVPRASFFDTGIQIVELGRENTASALAHAIAEGWCEIAGAPADLLRAAERNIVQGRDAYRRLRDLITRDDVPGARLDMPADPVRLFAIEPIAVAPSVRPRPISPKSMPSLSAAEIETFRRQGPFTAFDPQQVQQARQTILDRVLTTLTRYCPFSLRVRHLDSRTVYDLCSSPEILGLMASLSRSMGRTSTTRQTSPFSSRNIRGTRITTQLEHRADSQHLGLAGDLCRFLRARAGVAASSQSRWYPGWPAHDGLLLPRPCFRPSFR